MAEITAKMVKELRERTGAGMMDCKKALADAEGGDVEKAVLLLRERGLAKAVKREGRETSEGSIGIALAGSRGALVEIGCETDFVAKNEKFQALVAELAQAVLDHGADSAEALLAAEVDGAKVEEKLQNAIATIGENIVLKRVARIDVDGPGLVGGYVHTGGKIGVIVGLATGARGEPVEVLAKDLAMHISAADPSPVAVDRDGVPQELIEREREIFRKQALDQGKPEKIIDRIVDGRVNKYYAEVVLTEQPFVKDPDRAVKKLLEDVAAQTGGEVRVTAFARFKLGEAATS